MSDSLARIENEPVNVIKVQTFGGFLITYNGNEISFGNQSESQIVRLLQMLLHCREKGVSRDLARAELFGGRDIDDVSHSIRNIIYNLRKKLREFDLPDSQFVVKQNGAYYWADDVPVDEDASNFEDTLNKAMECEDKDEKLELLIQAIHQYTGKFLAECESSAWIERESERYRKLFASAMNEAAELLRDAHEFRQLYDLGVYASKADPFSEWEIMTLEALSGLGKFDLTEKFYKDTVEAYTAEFGSKSSNYIREFVNRIGLKLIIGHESLEEIQFKMRDESPHADIGYYCSLPVFQEIYRIAERILAPFGDRVFLMLCTIMDSKGNPMLNGARLEDLASRLKEAIINSAGYTDTVTRYGKGQYLALLIDTSYEECAEVAKRINSRFMKTGQRTSVNYSVSNIIVSAFPDGIKALNL